MSLFVKLKRRLIDIVGPPDLIYALAWLALFALAFPHAITPAVALDRQDMAGLPVAEVAALQQRHSGVDIRDWRDGFDFQFKGRTIALNRVNDDDEHARSLAIHLNTGGFLLGADRSFRSYDYAGKIRWRLAVPGPAWGVNLSADGRIVVAAFGDGTIRWHRRSDGQELLALFVNKATRAWVAWTPSGYYMSSPGGEDMIGWHLNRGWAQAADFFPASRFRDTYARPDVVERVLDTLDETEALRQADAARPRKPAPAVPLTERLPPVIAILSPADGSSVGNEVQVDYLVRSPSGLPVDAVEALVDGRPVPAGRGLGRLDEGGGLKQCLAQTRGLGRTDGALQGCRGSLAVSLSGLPPGAREVGLLARSGDRTSEVARVRLTHAAVVSGAELLKPKLYALAIGVSTYRNRDYALEYPAKDARDFAAALLNQKGGLYGDVEVRPLVDEEATAGGIREGLDWLTRSVTSRDVGVVFLAGHGVLDPQGRFYFLASDSDGERLRSTAVPKEDIRAALDALPGRQTLLFLDACHAGAISGKARRGADDINAVISDFASAEHGVTVFAASTGRQSSQESASWNNGAFTKAVVEGLGLPGAKAKADLVGTGTITTSQLDAYVANRVKALTLGEQSPVMDRPPVPVCLRFMRHHSRIGPAG